MNANYFPFNTPVKIFEAARFLLVVLFLLISGFSYGQLVRDKTIPSVDYPVLEGSLEIPAGVGIGDNLISVQTWGAGGGGGGPAALLGLVTLTNVAGGGGGGAFKKGTLNNVGEDPNNVKISYKVGLGGSGGISGSVNGKDGENTTFSTNGGKGGLAGIYSLVGLFNLTVSNGIGGKGGLGGDFSGGDGFNAGLLGGGIGLVSGSGGGGAGSGGSGGGGSPGILSQTGGSGGVVGADGTGAGGKGGDGRVVLNLLDGNGLSGVSPGGGGGGSALLLNLLDILGSPKGGKGGNGQIKVTYTCFTYGLTSLTADASCSSISTIKLHYDPVYPDTSQKLPKGRYFITYERTFQGVTTTVPNVGMQVTKAGEGEITVANLPAVGLTTIKIKQIKSVDCPTDNIDMSIVLGRPETLIEGAITSPTCAVPTGSVELSGLPSEGTWTINPIGKTGTGSTTTISGLAPGTTYNFTVSYGSCISDALNVSIGNLPPIRTWSNGTWDVVPTIENKAVFETKYDKDESVTACSCEVKSDAHVVFKSDRYLKIRNELVVDATGSLTFENKASLVQINDAAINSGKIIYKRITPSLIETDYTYWSSPVLNQTLNISPDYTYGTFYSFDSNNWAEKNTTTPMLLGKGYIIRGQRIDNTPYTITGTFIGFPNNGALTTAIGPANTLNLIGNPYPSALDASTFLNANSNRLYGTIYFWTHATAIQAASGIAPGKAGSGDYAYTSDDYASYNITGGVGTGNFKNGVEQTVNKPTGKIASGQAFFAYSNAATATNVIFNNSMRVGVGSITGNNSQFYRQSSTAKTTTATTIEKNRVWLNLTNKQGAFKQALVGYITGATNEYDDSFDGVSFNGNQYLDFYSIAQQTNLTIQGRALPFEQKDSVALGYKSAIKGEFQISIDETDGVLATQNIFVEDRDLKVLHDLKKTPYSFETEIGTFNDRFVLRYVDKNAITENIDDLQATTVSIATKDKKIDIKTTESVIDKIYIYDFSGNLVYSDAEINVTTTVISNLLVDHSALIVHVVLENGKKTVKKIMY